MQKGWVNTFYFSCKNQPIYIKVLIQESMKYPRYLTFSIDINLSSRSIWVTGGHKMVRYATFGSMEWDRLWYEIQKFSLTLCQICVGCPWRNAEKINIVYKDFFFFFTHTFIYSLSIMPSLSPSLSHLPSLPFPLSLSLSLTFPLTLSLSLSHPPSLSLSLPPSLSLSLPLPLSGINTKNLYLKSIPIKLLINLAKE